MCGHILTTDGNMHPGLTPTTRRKPAHSDEPERVHTQPHVRIATEALEHAHVRSLTCSFSDHVWIECLVCARHCLGIHIHVRTDTHSTYPHIHQYTSMHTGTHVHTGRPQIHTTALSRQTPSFEDFSPSFIEI